MVNARSLERPLILITGSSGLIGSRLVEALAPDHEVVGLDVKRPERLPGGAGFVECDMTERASVERALRLVRARWGARVASVLHLAAYYDFSGAPSPLYSDLTVGGTARLLSALPRIFDEVEQFVFSSSLLVMRPVEREGALLTEDSPVQAEWAYPESKLEAEQVIRDERGEIPAVILRIAGVYDDEGHGLPIAQQARRIYERQLESWFFPGDPDHGQPFVHMDDLVDLFARVVEARRRLLPFETFLVAEPDVVSYGELQEHLGELIHGRAWPALRLPRFAAKAGAWLRTKTSSQPLFVKPWMIDLADAHYPCSIERAERLLGWRPRRRLRDSLETFVAALLRDPARWYRNLGVDPPAGAHPQAPYPERVHAEERRAS